MFEFKEVEQRIQKFWEDHGVFQKSVAQRQGKPAFVFFEGPPTANGSPGIHHFIGRVFKDLFNRYKTMRGFQVLRKGGWDTHGLPVELQVEKELGFKNKKDIEVYGIAQFNAKCRESVWKYKTEWDAFTRRIGYWVDLQHPYITYETPYIESLWQVIAQFHKRKLLEQAHRVVPFCTRCGTPLSSHELGQPGAYRKTTDTSVYLKFKVTKSKLKLPENTFILAWTTTPWTLPGNVALAVGPDIQYVLAKRNDEHFVIAADLAAAVLGAPLEIEKEFTGSELVGTSYESLFSVSALKSPKAYKVYAADFVLTTDGTGIVHTAVMYGEDDYKLGTAEKLPKVHTVTEQGTFTGVSAELDGMYVKSAKTEAIILAHLETQGLLLKKVPYEHDYPFCWRCDTPLIYYAKDSWFVKMSSLNKQLVANNAMVNWVPAHLKEGRFGQWLTEGKDWNFSRNRYWGTPLPIWRSDSGKDLIISSLADLDTYRPRKANTYWLVRHGESDHNVQHIVDSGISANGLTDRGHEQVAAAVATLKKKFAKKKPVAILASPVVRAQQTAHAIADALGMPVTTDERLKEIQLGPSLEGKDEGAYLEMYPTLASRFMERPPGGESLADLRARQWNMIRELEETHEGKDIVIVGHEYPLWMFTDAAQGWTMGQSIAEKEKRGNDFIGLAGIALVTVPLLPRNDQGMVDPHRPYIDNIVLKKGTALYRRVPELCDVWFDSGAMPFAQWHWPFENEEIFARQFPADFITEGIDQTRGWFYTLLAVSTALGMGAPYKNVLSFGHVLDEKGQKMSKSKGNVVKPDEVIDTVGVDAARWYFYTVNDPGEPKLFNMAQVRERLTGFLGTLANCMRFYELYRSDVKDAPSHVHAFTEPTHLLDRWVLSRLNGLIQLASARMDEYDLTTAARAIEQFVVDDFSQWWLRRSRKRSAAPALLGHILRQLALLAAPFIPFTAENLWQKLKGQRGDAMSVHLADWPVVSAQLIDAALEEQMTQVRQFISAGLAIRKDQGIRVRQPLASVTLPGEKLPGDLEELVLQELNVKKAVYGGEEVILDMNIGTELRAEGYAREVMRLIQDMRKEVGLSVGDRVYCCWHSDDSEIVAALETHAEMIAHDTGLSAFERGTDPVALTTEKTMELAPGKSLRIGIRK